MNSIFNQIVILVYFFLASFVIAVSLIGLLFFISLLTSPGVPT